MGLIEPSHWGLRGLLAPLGVAKWLYGGKHVAPSELQVVEL